VLSDRKDLVHETKYGLTPLALSMPQWEEALMLSKPRLMSRKSVETFLWAIWRELTSSVRVVVVSEAERPASDPHWCWSRRPQARATQESLEFIIH